MLPTSTVPIAPSERAGILDVLRGLALLGIFINNIYGFSGYGFFTTEQRQQFTSFPADSVVDFLQSAFVEGKFYSLFSLLFGIGFSIILVRCEQKGANALKLFYRRLMGLMLIGAVHLFFFWEGDILLLYAVLGLLLPLFRRCTDRTLLVWAAVLILSPIVIDGLKLWLQESPAAFLQTIGEPIDTKNGITEKNWRGFLFTEQNGWNNWRAWQESAWAHRFYYLIDSNRLPKVLGVFLLGFYAGRRMIYARLSEYKPLLKKVMISGFAIGIPANLAMAYFERDEQYVFASAWGMADTITYALGVVPLAIAYASAISLRYLKKPSLLRFVAPAGRMALTTYLSQTVLGILLFYSAGLGLGQQFGLTGLFAVAIGIYLLQVLFSRWWLERFEYGPVEWVWRQLTYGKRLPLKKKTDPASLQNRTITIASNSADV